jgi:hypothetical protein
MYIANAFEKRVLLRGHWEFGPNEGIDPYRHNVASESPFDCSHLQNGYDAARPVS